MFITHNYSVTCGQRTLAVTLKTGKFQIKTTGDSPFGNLWIRSKAHKTIRLKHSLSDGQVWVVLTCPSASYLPNVSRQAAFCDKLNLPYRPPVLRTRPFRSRKVHYFFHLIHSALRHHMSYETTFFQSLEGSRKIGLTGLVRQVWLYYMWWWLWLWWFHCVTSSIVFTVIYQL